MRAGSTTGAGAASCPRWRRSTPIPGKGVDENMHSTDVESTTRVRVSISTFTLKLSLENKHSTDVESTTRVRVSV